MKVINLIGGPSAGKSTLALGLAYEMKKAGYNVELVTEYAKDIIWEERMNLLEQQEYIFAKQNRKLYRLRKKVDFVITDSPLFLNLFYLKKSKTPAIFSEFIKEVMKTYDNEYFFVNRAYPYDPVGRYQTEKEANEVSNELKQIMIDENLSFKEVISSDKDIQRIIREVTQ